MVLVIEGTDKNNVFVRFFFGIFENSFNLEFVDFGI